MPTLEQMEAVARKAHPGPWHFKENRKTFYVKAKDGTYITALVNGVYATDANTAHIATFDPPTVLKLLAVAKAALLARDDGREDALESALQALTKDAP